MRCKSSVATSPGIQSQDRRAVLRVGCLLLGGQHHARVQSDDLDEERERVHEAKLPVLKWMHDHGNDQKGKRNDKASSNLGDGSRPNENHDRSLHAGESHYLNDLRHQTTNTYPENARAKGFGKLLGWSPSSKHTPVPMPAEAL